MSRFVFVAERDNFFQGRFYRKGETLELPGKDAPQWFKLLRKAEEPRQGGQRRESTDRRATGNQNQPPDATGDQNTPPDASGDQSTPPDASGDQNTPPNDSGDQNKDPA